jgi:hypothetical protein
MNLKQIEDDLMVIISQDSPELDILYKKLVESDYTQKFDPESAPIIEFVTDVLDTYKEGAVDFDSECGTLPYYPEQI